MEHSRGVPRDTRCATTGTVAFLNHPGACPVKPGQTGSNRFCWSAQSGLIMAFETGKNHLYSLKLAYIRISGK
jgi:hypothetical protein